MTTINLNWLSPHLRVLVLDEVRDSLLARKWLSLPEAAWLYGYQPQSLRQMVASKAVRSRRIRGRRMVSHTAMRSYLAANNLRGLKRKARQAQQTTLA